MSELFGSHLAFDFDKNKMLSSTCETLYNIISYYKQVFYAENAGWRCNGDVGHWKILMFGDALDYVTLIVSDVFRNEHYI